MNIDRIVYADDDSDDDALHYKPIDRTKTIRTSSQKTPSRIPVPKSHRIIRSTSTVSSPDTTGKMKSPTKVLSQPKNRTLSESLQLDRTYTGLYSQYRKQAYNEDASNVTSKVDTVRASVRQGPTDLTSNLPLRSPLAKPTRATKLRDEAIKMALHN
jgi:hypothetical protein